MNVFSPSRSVGCDQPLPQNDQVPRSALRVLDVGDMPPEKSDDDRPLTTAVVNEVTAELRAFLRQNREDSQKGLTRQRNDDLLRSIADEQQKLRLDVQAMKSDIDKQFLAHGFRLDNLEATSKKQDDRIIVVEKKLGEVSEDTGSFKLVEGERAKTREKWRDRFISAGIMLVIAVASAFALRALGLDLPHPVEQHEK
jgi:NhaP-type Na+/H+ and K+/H+ antiporter